MEKKKKELGPTGNRRSLSKELLVLLFLCKSVDFCSQSCLKMNGIAINPHCKKLLPSSLRNMLSHLKSMGPFLSVIPKFSGKCLQAGL